MTRKLDTRVVDLEDEKYLLREKIKQAALQTIPVDMGRKQVDDLYEKFRVVQNNISLDKVNGRVWVLNCANTLQYNVDGNYDEISVDYIVVITLDADGQIMPHYIGCLRFINKDELTGVPNYSINYSETKLAEAFKNLSLEDRLSPTDLLTQITRREGLILSDDQLDFINTDLES